MSVSALRSGRGCEAAGGGIAAARGAGIGLRDAAGIAATSPVGVGPCALAEDPPRSGLEAGGGGAMRFFNGGGGFIRARLVTWDAVDATVYEGHSSPRVARNGRRGKEPRRRN